jgi:origin recognition complex subunit 1
MLILQNELYLTSDMDENPLESIIGPAIILSENAFKEKFPTGKIPPRSKDQGKVFFCRRGCNQRNGSYTEEFIWEDLKHKSEADVQALVERVEAETESTKKRKYRRQTKADDDFRGGNIDDEELETPRKKQKHSNVFTPRKPRTPSKLLTPSRKR